MNPEWIGGDDDNKEDTFKEFSFEITGLNLENIIEKVNMLKVT